MTAKSVEFTTGFVMNETGIVVAASPDDDPPFRPFTRIFQFTEQPSVDWWVHNEDWLARSITYFGPSGEIFDDTVVLSEDGHVQYLGEHAALTEKISGAGVHAEDSKGWGYLSDLQQIGDHLYASGYRGQVYKRRGPNDWIHFDEGLLQTPDTPMEQSIALSVINGPHENAIYAAGYEGSAGHPPKAFFWNGERWREIQLPPVAEGINNMYIESEQRIWMCGSNGTLLLGNAVDGFNSLSAVEDNQWFLSICKYRDLIFLGSNLGLFFYDPNNHAQGIREVKTNLQPELQDANIVDCAGEVLWSIGPKDIARFDGKTWTRVDHPDNPPIR
jgi:hypothetical protein